MIGFCQQRWLATPAGDRGIVALFVILLTAHLGAVFLFPVFPNQDGPVHLYYAQVVERLWENPDAYGGLFTIQHRLPPYAVHSYALIFLSLLFSPVFAEKVLVAGQMLLLASGFAYLVTALNRRWSWGVLLVFPLLFHRFVMMGFQGFCIGTGALLFFLGFWLRYHSRLNRTGSVIFLALLGLLLWSHPVPLLMGFGLIAAHTALGVAGEARNTSLRSALNSRRRQIAHVGIASMTLLYLAAFTGGGSLEGLVFDGERIQTQLYRLYVQAPVTPLGDPAFWWSLTLFELAGLAAALAALRFSGRGVNRFDQLFVLAAGVGCLAFFLLAPSEMGGGFSFDARFPLTGYLLILAAASVLRLPSRPLAATAIAITLFSGFVLAGTVRMLYPAATEWRVLLEAPVMKPFAKGAIVAGGKFYENVRAPHLRFSPCMWSPAHYFIRSDAALLNAPWRAWPWIMVTTRELRPYLAHDPPPLGRLYQSSLANDRAALPQQLDFFIGVDCSANERSNDLFDQIADMYDLQRMSWSTSDYVFYANPAMLR